MAASSENQMNNEGDDEWATDSEEDIDGDEDEEDGDEEMKD